MAHNVVGMVKVKCATRDANIDSLARDLTKLAREQSLDPVVGRGTEVRRLIQILSRRTKTILS